MVSFFICGESHPYRLDASRSKHISGSAPGDLPKEMPNEVESLSEKMVEQLASLFVSIMVFAQSASSIMRLSVDLKKT